TVPERYEEQCGNPEREDNVTRHARLRVALLAQHPHDREAPDEAPDRAARYVENGQIRHGDLPALSCSGRSSQGTGQTAHSPLDGLSPPFRLTRLMRFASAFALTRFGGRVAQPILHNSPRLQLPRLP